MSAWECVCELKLRWSVCVTGLVSCTPGRPVTRASASWPLPLKPRHHQQSESHLYIIPSQNRARDSAPWALVTWWVPRITVLMAHDNISAAEVMKHAGDLLLLDRCRRSCWKIHVVSEVAYRMVMFYVTHCVLIVQIGHKCHIYSSKILTVPSFSSVSL